MKKIYSVILGLVAGLVTVLVLDQLFKGLIAYIEVGSSVQILFRGIRLNVEFPAENVKSFFIFSAIIISPFVLSLFLIEITLAVLGRLSSDHVRSAVIVFQIINIGYLIFAAVLGILSVALHTASSSEWSLLLDYGGLSYNQKLIFVFLIMFLLLGYINILTKRIRKSIPVINKQKLSKP